MDREEIRRQRQVLADHKAARLRARALKLQSEGERRSERGWADLREIPLGQPILVGHYSEKRDRAYRGRATRNIDKGIELQIAADALDKRAASIQGSVRVAGDAEIKRQAERDALDTLLAVGSKIYDFAYREGEIVRVNKKTYTIRFSSGWTTTRDKSFVRPL